MHYKKYKLIFNFLEYLLKASTTDVLYTIAEEITELQDQLFNQAIDIIKTISDHSNYGAPRWLTVCQFVFSRGNVDEYTNLDFTICFHIISTCPGLKYLFQKTLYKHLKYKGRRSSY
jgi:hypothetical protein